MDMACVRCSAICRTSVKARCINKGHVDPCMRHPGKLLNPLQECDICYKEIQRWESNTQKKKEAERLRRIVYTV
ncbi:hypothetical protein OH77DRAFT_1420058 [Trametes cingulata]|nr:hypothetical protein OH77DRAFT_1420058 [Trametes cingulata]